MTFQGKEVDVDDGRTLLRHTLATLAYRAGKTLREAPEGFASFSSSASPVSSSSPGAVRTPLQILAHMGDLLEWSASVVSGAEVRHDPKQSRLRSRLSEDVEIRAKVSASVRGGGGGPAASEVQEWPLQVARFFNALERFDAFLASTAVLGAAPARLFQGPVADALTHVGQLAMLRREFGAPILRESYFDADIVTGRVGFDQPPPRK
jgi:hypothetical protein